MSGSAVGEALPLLLTLSSGVKGFTTIHARSARQALSRLRFICQPGDTTTSWRCRRSARWYPDVLGRAVSRAHVGQPGREAMKRAKASDL